MKGRPQSFFSVSCAIVASIQAPKEVKVPGTKCGIERTRESCSLSNGVLRPTPRLNT